MPGPRTVESTHTIIHALDAASNRRAATSPAHPRSTSSNIEAESRGWRGTAAGDAKGGRNAAPSRSRLSSIARCDAPRSASVHVAGTRGSRLLLLGLLHDRALGG